MLKIIPQKFCFSQPGLYKGTGEQEQVGINVEISFDAQQADKESVRKQLEVIFEQVIEYFR